MFQCLFKWIHPLSCSSPSLVLQLEASGLLFGFEDASPAIQKAFSASPVFDLCWGSLQEVT